MGGDVIIVSFSFINLSLIHIYSLSREATAPRPDQPCQATATLASVQDWVVPDPHPNATKQLREAMNEDANMAETEQSTDSTVSDVDKDTPQTSGRFSFTSISWKYYNPNFLVLSNYLHE